MSKKGKRLREFEKNNRSFSVSEAGRERQQRRKRHKPEETFSLVESKQQAAPQKKKQKKNKITNIRRFVAFAIIIFFIASVSVSAVKLIKLKNQESILLQRNAELKELKEDLTAAMENINSAEYIEQQARKELKMIKDGEILFILPDETEDGSAQEDGQAKD